MYRRRAKNQEPREITAKFGSKCAETGREIRRGDPCIYYPKNREVFHPDSQQAYEFRQWQQDQMMGYNY